MAKAKIGRPRCGKSQEAILAATHDLLQEKGGAGLTIEAIAKRAEVGKPTIYRWWPSLADIVLEVLLSQADTEIAAPLDAPLQETLRQFLRRSMQVITDGAGVHLRFLMAHAQQNETFRERFRENFNAVRRNALRSVFQQAREKGEICAEQNLDLLVDLIFGAMWYRLLIGHATLDQAFADELTESAMRLVQAGPA
ncbi:MAG: TetR/AcrR family transcriptional regulator [Desulfovibrio sp.]|nr:MAG: TetR/AcrR family transcriptional regulator [Desulfovibrio sp.]